MKPVQPLMHLLCWMSLLLRQGSLFPASLALNGAPAQGLLIYNTTTNYFNVYNTASTAGWYELIFTSYIGNTTGAGYLGIGVAFNASGAAPAPSAICDIYSNIKGVLIPRTTTGGISGPATGLCIYNTTDNGISYYNGSAWIPLCGQYIDNTTGGGSLAGTAGIGISANSSVPDDCAMLDISSTTQGLLIPRMVDADRDFLNPATGLLIYNTGTNLLNYWNGTGWYSITSSGPAQPSVITGTSPLCVGATGVAYSVTNVPGVTYAWSYSGTGFTCVTNCTTNSITADYSGVATSGTLSVTPSNVCGNGTVQTLPITVNADPAFSVQPSSASICVGGSYSPSVTVTGGVALTYQWQYSSGGAYANVVNGTPAGSTYSNQTTSTMTVSGITAVGGTKNYQCVVSDATSGCTASITSNAGALTVNADPAFSAHPAAGTICVGGSANKSVTVTGGVALTYQWQYSNGGAYANVVDGTPAGSAYSNQTTAAMTVSGITVAGGTNNYKSLVSDATSGCTASILSNAGTLTVNADPAFSVHPADATICVGESYSPSITVTGGATKTYQWKYSSGGAYANVVNNTPAGSTYSNQITATMTVVGITAAGGTNNYQCVVSDAGSGCTTPITSNAATLTVNADPSFSVQPSSASICLGGSYSPSVTATGGVTLSYQWQYSNGGAYANVVNGTPAGSTYSNQTTATMTVSGITAIGGTKNYQCVVSSTGNGCTTPINSSAGALTVNADPTFSVQPTSASICVGGSYSPSVTVTGGVTLSYQWQYSNGGAYANVVDGTPAGSTYSNPTTATMTVSGITAAGGTNNYQCVVSDAGSGCTASINSNAAALTINDDPTFSVQPSDGTICGVGSYSTSVTVTGGATLSYQWQYSNGGAYADVVNGTPTGATYTNQATATMTVSGITVVGGTNNYQCVVSDAGSGCTASITSNAAALTISVGTLTVNHTIGNVAPETKTVTYGLVQTSLSGTSKCWITRNLGATGQATSAASTSNSHVGWFWQFNRKQGYMVGPTPAWTITAINENSDWTAAEDPCTIELGAGWRIPTMVEWGAVAANDSWGNYVDGYNSVLKLHAGGELRNTDGVKLLAGTIGFWWAIDQAGWVNGMGWVNQPADSRSASSDKADGASLRCIKD